MLNTPLAILLATTIILCPTMSSSNSRERLTVPKQQQYSSHEPTNQMLRHMKECGKKYKVKPEIILAVAKVEGQDLKDGLIRLGPMGKGTYSGPMGIYWGFGCPPYNWDIDNPFVNVDRGARRLHGDLRARLIKYNTCFTERYLKDIRALAAKYEEEKVFERSDNGVMFKCTTYEVAQLFKGQ